VRQEGTISGVQTSSRISLYAAFWLIVLDLQIVAMISVTEFRHYKTFLSQALGPQKGYDIPGW
jgi:hypothetical protein